jgi:protein O-mannosyl-transferase
MVDLVFGMAKRVSNPSTSSKRRVVIGICVALTTITWLVFGQTLRHQFVTYDDPQYVYSNPDIIAGLSMQRALWAFTHAVAGNWHPLTIISHMLDCQLYGLKASGHHFTNVLLHTVAVILLFLVQHQMTGALLRSAFVAALFAIHPLHVESVAWVSERKDVLSAVFFMLTLGTYVRYVRTRLLTSYLLALLLFALGLMSKPMLVTLPFVLLLLDYWPLGRFSGQRSEARRHKSKVGGLWSTVSAPVLEKLPLFALSAVSSAATLLMQGYRGRAFEQLPFVWRLNNAAVSYIAYIWQMFWPTRLAPFYPHPNNHLPLWWVLLATAFLISASLLAIYLREKRPYVFTGWFWYVGMLVPVVGLVQVGEQARADRYTYLPQIGLYILIVWTVASLIAPLVSRTGAAATSRQRARPRVPGAAPSPRVRDDSKQSRPLERSRTVPPWNWRAWRTLFAVTGVAIVISLSWCSFIQTSYWQSSEALWNHMLAVTGDNDVAHNNLGNLFVERRDLDSAISHFEAALEIRSRSSAAHYKAGSALIENSLASVLTQKGRLSEAIAHYEDAISLRPDYGDPYFNLGNVLSRRGQMTEAIGQWRKAAATQPKDARFHALLGDAFLRNGLDKEAIAVYEHAARISTHDPLVCNNLAWLLATSSDASIRDGGRAMELAKQAVRLSRGKDPNYLRTLAAAFAESGRFAEARETAQRALQEVEIQGNSTLANTLRDEIELYELGLPYHR